MEDVIPDTDIGDDIDDVFALGIVLANPEVHLLGLTSAWGNTALRSRMIDRVLCEFGGPIFMMPLDSTQISFDAEHASSFASISTPLTDSMEVLAAEWSRVTHRTTPSFFDPVAVAYAIDPKTGTANPKHVEVDDNGFTRVTPGTPNVQACLEENPEAFFSLVVPQLMQEKLSGTKACTALR